MDAPKVWRTTATGIELRVRLTPKSSRDQVDGIETRGDGEILKARVRAVPEDGKANAALVTLVAGWLAVPQRSVELVGGGKSRIKTIAVSGDSARLSAALAVVLAPAKTP
jgi:hypothetical protein